MAALKGLILAVDTAGDGVSLALSDGKKTWSLRRQTKAADEALWPALDSLLKKAKARLSDLKGVACVTGPGRFTAVRIGVTFADSLARARGLPVVGLTRFEAFAPRLKTPGRFGLVVPTFREESYLQLWTEEGPAAPPTWVAAGGLPAALAGAVQIDASPASAKDLLAPARALLAKKRRPPLRPLYLKPANYAK
ncbi:tRNA (adenosine(37)-N6)-threonylcarbamoyltransferase complex dimerization subunit type 1 TsaB [bacterium]|nr:MAG: tRNA (adenosine(37)-N6)-threonylcarbamoyltransferase complex dimerization subunit type 1 TsaB [bacterium]